MKRKPAKNPDPNAQAVPDLPVPPDQATDVKGGLTIGDIKGESTDKDHKHL